MKVKEVMGTEVVSIGPGAKYEEAARVMVKNKFSGLPVVSERGELVGIISEKDLFRAMFPDYQSYTTEPHAYLNREALEERIKDIRNNPVAMYMSPRVFTIEPEAPVLKAGGIMLARGVHRLPVLQNGKIVGIVTREEIYGTILKRYLGLN
jgi:CBS domain-containing protein